MDLSLRKRRWIVRKKLQGWRAFETFNRNDSKKSRNDLTTNNKKISFLPIQIFLLSWEERIE